MDTVGIVGLGVMGSNCAKKLMESGVPVAGYDPYPPAVKRASEAGVAVCGSPAGLAGKARVSDAEAQQATGATIVRQIRPGQGVTMDYRKERVTIETDPKTGRIIRAYCG